MNDYNIIVRPISYTNEFHFLFLWNQTGSVCLVYDSIVYENMIVLLVLDLCVVSIIVYEYDILCA